MFKLKKSLGQNFLRDNNTLNKIVSLESLSNQNILEIGPGSGNLTNLIFKQRPKSFYLIEKDKRFYEILKEKYKRENSLNILNKDILDFNLNDLKEKDVIVFGNLPYNISTQILAKFIKIDYWPPFYKKIIFMFQSEVADKIIAKPKSNNFGRISILTNLRLNIIDNFKISRKCFFPIPKVDSKIIIFEPKNTINYNILKINSLEKVTQLFFSKKRKMIKKTLMSIFPDYNKISRNLNIDLSSRPSELSFDTYYKITEMYEKINKF